MKLREPEELHEMVPPRKVVLNASLWIAIFLLWLVSVERTMGVSVAHASADHSALARATETNPIPRTMIRPAELFARRRHMPDRHVALSWRSAAHLFP